MTELLERAIARLKTLPSSEQDAIAPRVGCISCGVTYQLLEQHGLHFAATNLFLKLRLNRTNIAVELTAISKNKSVA